MPRVVVLSRAGGRTLAWFRGVDLNSMQTEAGRLTFVRDLLVDSPQLGDPGIGRRRGQRGFGVPEVEAARRAVGSCFSHFCGSCMGSCNDMVGRQNPQPYVVLARFRVAGAVVGAVLLQKADFRRGLTLQM